MSMQTGRAAMRRSIVIAAVLLSGAPRPLHAAQAVPATPAPATQQGEVSEFPRVTLTAGRSMVLTTEFDITRIAVTNPAIADAVVVQPREVLIDGKAPGVISLIMWGGDRRAQYDLVVEQPIAALEQQLHQLFPGEPVSVAINADAIVLSGKVSSTAVMLRVAEVAKASAAKASVINMLQVPGAQDAQQVMLQVRFAEVNRRALTQLGSSVFTGAAGFKNWVARGTTQQFSAPDFADD